MKTSIGLALPALLLAVAAGDSSPTQARKPQMIEMPPLSTQFLAITCKAGERTCFIASTISKEPVVLGLYVYDPHGNCIARDEFYERLPPDSKRRPATDDVAAEWFPPVEALYVIELRNLASSACKAQSAFR